MIAEIEFKNTNEPLFVEFQVEEGVIAASYIMTLFKTNVNEPLLKFEGNNVNDEDDKFKLPEPPGKNDGRILRLNVSFYGLDPEKSKNYQMKMNVYQGNEFKGAAIKKGIINDSETQNFLSFVKLKMK